MLDNQTLCLFRYAKCRDEFLYKYCVDFLLNYYCFYVRYTFYTYFHNHSLIVFQTFTLFSSSPARRRVSYLNKETLAHSVSLSHSGSIVTEHWLANTCDFFLFHILCMCFSPYNSVVYEISFVLKKTFHCSFNCYYYSLILHLIYR